MFKFFFRMSLKVFVVFHAGFLIRNFFTTTKCSSSFFPTKLCGALVFRLASPPRSPPPPPPPPPRPLCPLTILSQTTLSHTSHTQLCHTHTHTCPHTNLSHNVTYKFSHTNCLSRGRRGTWRLHLRFAWHAW